MKISTLNHNHPINFKAIKKASLKCKCKGEGNKENGLPKTPLQMVEQAKESITKAIKDGIKRQSLKLLLPVNEKEYAFMATEAFDYPCNIQTEFQSCETLAKAILNGISQNKKLLNKQLDIGGVEGEPCSVIYDEDKEIASFVFPTSDRLSDIKSLINNNIPKILIINPQWRESGQVISDFGFGPRKKAAEELLNTFKETYSLIEQRIGSPSSVDPVTGQRYRSGGVVRILHAYPDPYKVFVLASEGSHQFITEYEYMPSYKELEDMLRDARNSKKYEIFNIATKVTEPGYYEKSSNENIEENNVGLLLSDSQIDLMDAATLRKALIKLGLPSSGKISKLRDRLKKEIDNEM